jgi:microcin C transport system permease protein
VKDGSSFDSWTSGIIIAAYAIPGLLIAVLLLVLFAGGSYWKLFPLRGLTSDGFEDMSMIGKALDYLWHITLPVLASTISSFATLTLLTKNSFLDEIRKQYVMTARAKGLSGRWVLYGHVFRNAMLIVIAGFPALFISVFFGGNLIIENIFSLDGLGQLGFRSAVERDYPVVFGTLFAFGLMGLVVGILSDLMYVWIDPRIDFERRG